MPFLTSAGILLLNLSFFRSAIVEVYPIGIPVLYSVLLRRKWHLLNPRAVSVGKRESYGPSKAASVDGVGGWNGTQSSIMLTTSNGQTKTYWSPQELQELDERVKA